MITSMRDTRNPERMDVSVPAGLRYVRVLRLAAAGALSTQYFAVDFVEDVRAAVGEAAALVLGEGGGRGRLHLSVGCSEDSVEVVMAGVFDRSPVRDADRNEMAELMLAPLVDSYDLRPDTDTVCFAKSCRRADRPQDGGA